MRRRCLGIRCRTSLILVIVTVCLYGLYYSYQSLTQSEKNSNRRNAAFASLDKRKGLHFRAAKQRSSEVGANSHERLPQNDWQRRSMVSGALKFNPILQNKILNFINTLYPTDWASATEPDEVALELKSLLLDIGLESNMSCKEIDSLQIGGTLAQSNKKYIERGRFENYYSHEVTIKSQSFDVDTKIECMKKIYDVERCSPMGNYKLMREILYLAILRHPGIVSMLGYCVRGDQISPEIRKKGLILITEVGHPLQSGALTNLPWSTKVMFALQLANLLEYLESSPIGNIALGKLKMQDFILVNSGYSLRLVDLDDLVPHEKSCHSDMDCYVDGKAMGVSCKSEYCEGYTLAANMHKVTSVMLDPMLRNSPASQAQRIDDLLNRLLNNEISTQDLTTALKEIQEQAGAPPAPVIQRWNQPQVVHQPQDNPDLNRPSNQFQLAPVRRSSDYIRYDQTNYQGLYDFACDNSRVVWGCVLTARSVGDAKNICDTNPHCEAFVVYSSQPESDTLMTIILKNSTQTTPQQAAGTTLFIRREGRVQQPELNLPEKREEENKIETNHVDTNNVVDTVVHNNAPATEKVAEPLPVPMSRETCIKKSTHSHEEAHKSRERRLMTHLGLKGMRENDWFQAVVSQSIASFTGVTPATGTSPKGGKLVAKFLPSDSQEMKITKALFIAERGPEQFHAAHSIVYQTDRLLGLYHTPPSIVMKMPADVVQKFSEDSDFRRTFTQMIDHDGTLKGLFTVPIPHVMKPEALTIQPLKKMVTAVKKFSRLMKMQFEYTFLWWLTKIAKGPDSHIGYKGHMIHFDADQAFEDITAELTGYMYHCQFPNIVYKTLNCFRCTPPQGQTTTSSVCTLGQEVVKRTKNSGLKRTELRLGKNNDNEYILEMNKAATTALQIVDKCIRKHGRELVLY